MEPTIEIMRQFATLGYPGDYGRHFFRLRSGECCHGEIQKVEQGHLRFDVILHNDEMLPLDEDDCCQMLVDDIDLVTLSIWDNEADMWLKVEWDGHECRPKTK